MLRPGVHVLRRGADELQVGLDPARAIVLPDRPEVRRLVRALTSPATRLEEGEYDAGTLEVLAASDLLVDADLLLPLIPTGPTTASRTDGPSGPPLRRADVAAVAAEAGDQTRAVLDRRRRTQVIVATTANPESAAMAERLVDLLTCAGVSVRGPGDRAPAGPHERGRRRPAAPAGPTAPAVDGPAVGVMVAVGEPARELFDDWMRETVRHLVLRLSERHAVVGPFVTPGETACLRCIDAHHADVDPAWPLLVSQQAAASAREREDTVPEPVDSVLAALAAAWAARELVSAADGRPPVTESSTIRLDPHLTAVETHTWPRHPACGCAWT